MSAQLKDLYERKASALRRRPSFGQASAQVQARLVGDVACEVALGDRTTLCDLPVEEGGTGCGPHPGQLMRASVAACLVIGYKLWGARLGIPVDGADVELTCEYDARGQMGLADDVATGWQRMVIDVTITSTASESDVHALVAHADRLSPMLGNLNPALVRVHRLTIKRPRPKNG